mmetsp:Transcript_12928/g.36187  ORF Transcript_12928/g.36187 Transcript_12928/m.36187 type:complete len:237 (+) Transcript_12928:148-858(+)
MCPTSWTTIRWALMQNPQLLEFLRKHRSVMQNLNPENLKFLTRNVQRTSKSDSTMQQAGSAAGRAIRISGLPPEATEADLEALLHRQGFSPAEVSLACESRFRRSVGVAIAVLPSLDMANEAIAELGKATLNGHRLHVEWAGAPPGQREAGGRRIAWKKDDELWDVAIFDKFESVLTFSERIANHTMPAPSAAVVAPASSEAAEALTAMARAEEFREAMARERAEEAQRVREALSG